MGDPRDLAGGSRMAGDPRDLAGDGRMAGDPRDLAGCSRMFGDPRDLARGGRRVWLPVAVAELAIILILVVGLGLFVAEERWVAEQWLECQRGVHSETLALQETLASTNVTLQETQEGWDGCKNHTHVLQETVTSLTQHVTQLNTTIAQLKVEKRRLQDEISAWKNISQLLQEQNDQYRREVSWLQQQLQKQLGLRSGEGSTRLPSLLPLLAVPLARLLV